MSTLHISINNNTDFKVDASDNLSVVQQDTWGKAKNEVVIGFLTPRLIDQMIENLNRLRPFAK